MIHLHLQVDIMPVARTFHQCQADFAYYEYNLISELDWSFAPVTELPNPPKNF